MTLSDLQTALETTGLPVAYHRFDEPQELPFIVFSEDGEDDLTADDIHYTEITTGYIELYTTQKDLINENMIKSLLNSLTNLAFEKEDESYISSEEVFYVRWSYSFV